MAFTADNWNADCRGTPINIFHQKPKRLRAALRDWNWNTFGDLRIRKSNLLSDIESLESSLQDQNSALCALPREEEVEKAIKLLNPQSSPGPDGFTGFFYIQCRSIIKQDLMAAITDFFLGVQIPQGMSSANLVLIPKTPNPSSFQDFRPISLCNFSHKIISKVLADRLAVVLPHIISREQTGFVKGRNILENISLAHEIIDGIDNKVKGGNVTIKLDMSKAYDRVNWRFLLRVLHRLGFNHIWIDLIYRLISNCWYSVSINRRTGGFFCSGRGLRQGDPISPALFIIAHDALSRQITKLSLHGQIKHFSGRRNCLHISHLFYADDSLIFLNGGAESVDNLMQSIQEYEAASGQVINMSKSSLITSHKTHMLS